MLAKWFWMIEDEDVSVQDQSGSSLLHTSCSGWTLTPGGRCWTSALWKETKANSYYRYPDNSTDKSRSWGEWSDATGKRSNYHTHSCQMSLWGTQITFQLKWQKNCILTNAQFWPTVSLLSGSYRYFSSTTFCGFSRTTIRDFT